MLTSKTRTTIIGLVVACSFAGASLVPAVSQARPKKPTQHRKGCITPAGKVADGNSEISNIFTDSDGNHFFEQYNCSNGTVCTNLMQIVEPDTLILVADEGCYYSPGRTGAGPETPQAPVPAGTALGSGGPPPKAPGNGTLRPVGGLQGSREGGRSPRFTGTTAVNSSLVSK